MENYINLKTHFMNHKIPQINLGSSSLSTEVLYEFKGENHLILYTQEVKEKLTCLYSIWIVETICNLQRHPKINCASHQYWLTEKHGNHWIIVCENSSRKTIYLSKIPLDHSLSLVVIFNILFLKKEV